MKTLIIILTLCAASGVVGAWIGSLRGRAVAGFWLGAGVGPVGWIVACLLPAVSTAPKLSVPRQRSMVDPVEAWEQSQAPPLAPRPGWRERLEGE